MWLVHVIIFSCITFGLCVVRNNVCPDINDYKNRKNNSNCWFNPDVDTTPELVASHHGVQFQNYILTTKDGYHLQLFRVLKTSISGPKKPIFLMHDIFNTAMAFMLVGSRSLAFYLADKGYDVWLGNMRGTTYSIGNSIMRDADAQYWEYSYQEVAVHDLPASFYFIKKKTNQPMLYIGHGVGATVAFMYILENQSLAPLYLKGIIGLGTVGYAPNPTKAMRYFKSLEPRHKLRSKIFNAKFKVRRPLQLLARIICQNYPGVKICQRILTLVSGYSYHELLPEDIPMIFSYFPSSFSVNTFLHYMQIFSSRKLMKFDYGPEGNLQKYGSEIPPEYNLTKIKLPVHLYYGENDQFAGGQEVAEGLIALLGSSHKMAEAIPDKYTAGYTHLDFVVGAHVKEYLYDKMLTVIQQLLP